MLNLLVTAIALNLGPPEVALRFELLDGPKVRVTVDIPGDADGTTDLKIQPEWGGFASDPTDITGLEVRDHAGKTLTVTHPETNRWVVTHDRADRLSLSYTIPSRTLPPTQRGNDYRIRLDSSGFHFIGELGLIIPEHLESDEVCRVTAGFKGFDRDGWSIVSSYGAGAGPFTVSQTMQDARRSLILAGKLSVLTRRVQGNTVAVAIKEDDWKVDPEQLADCVAAIVKVERDFWSDHSDPWFLVTLVANGTSASKGSFSIGGTGLDNSFALFCNNDITLDPDSPRSLQVKVLLAHEYFHTWNGGKIASSAEEGAGYWMSEGFTDFYARRLLLRAGLISPQEFVAKLNEALERGGGNPEKNASAARINDLFWKNSDVQHVPYERGDRVALAVDEEIRSVSKGARSLDDLMIDLFHRTRSGEKYSSELVLRLIEKETSKAFADSVRACVVDGADLRLPDSIAAPPARRGTGVSRSFDPGFDTSASVSSKVVTGVREGTEAHKAGLRDGQKIRGMSISSGGPDGPPSAKVTIDDNGQKRDIVYDPLSPPREVTAYSLEHRHVE